MKHSTHMVLGATAMAAASVLVLSGCSSSSSTPSAESSGGALTPVTLQLQWVPQAQFAGYFAADALGFWEELGLDVTIVDGGPDNPPQVEGSLPDGPEFAVSWVPRVLAVRDPASRTRPTW